MAETVTVRTAEREYCIEIKKGLLAETGKKIRALGFNSHVVVSDENVWLLHGKVLSDSLNAAEISFTPIILPPGEQSKSFAALEMVLNKMVEAGFEKSGLVIAFGGGTVGDLAGFAASVFMRGTAVVQIPTTLLACIDSSLGGKTAVNLAAGKNLAGTFFQPRCVFIDPLLLKTLPERELVCGMAEMIKYALLCSPELWATLETQSLNTEKAIADCCRIKAGFVESDEKDFGCRRLLNLGHTFGHAIEALGNFSRFNHGEAIAAGLATAAEYGEKKGLTLPGTAEKIKRLLLLYLLPANPPFSGKKIFEQMLFDKKKSGGIFQLIIPEKIGNAYIFEVSENELKKDMEEFWPC